MLASAVTIPALISSARADADDTISVVTGYSLRHESNLFRLPPGTDTQGETGKSGKSDDIGIASLGFRLDKRYSLQRLQFEANLVNYRYHTFDHLNFTARNYAAAWSWQLTPAFQGNLTSSRTEALNSFNDFTGYGVRNVRTDENHRLDGVLELDGAWRALGGVAQTVRANSETFLEESDTRLNTVEAGVRRDFRSGSSLSLITRRGRGEYFNRSGLSPTQQLDNAFEQREQELKLTWPMSAKTTLQGRLAHLERRHEHFPARDYSGQVGNLSVTLRATDKLLLTGGFAHALDPFQSNASSYASTNRFALGTLWRITEKTSVRGQYDIARRDFRGAITNSSADGRHDTLRHARIGIEWEPYRSVVLGAALEHERRDSNQSGYDFKNSTGTVSAQFTF